MVVAVYLSLLPLCYYMKNKKLMDIPESTTQNLTVLNVGHASTLGARKLAFNTKSEGALKGSGAVKPAAIAKASIIAI